MFIISSLLNFSLKFILFGLMFCVQIFASEQNAKQKETELFKNHDKLSIQIEKINKLENYVNDYAKFTNSLSEHAKKEVEAFNKISTNFSTEKKKAYNSLSNEAKSFLKEEKIAKNNIVILMQENDNIILKKNNNELNDTSNLKNDNTEQKLVSEPERLEKLKNAIAIYSKLLASVNTNVQKELDEYRDFLAKINAKNQDLYKKLGKDSKEYLKKNRMHKKAIMQMLSK